MIRASITAVFCLEDFFLIFCFWFPLGATEGKEFELQHDGNSLSFLMYSKSRWQWSILLQVTQITTL